MSVFFLITTHALLVRYYSRDVANICEYVFGVFKCIVRQEVENIL